MPIFETATYRVAPEGIDEVKAAIREFVDYVRANDPGTTGYAASQQQDDATRFLHLFIFEDEAAHAMHSESDAVAKFESIYTPHLLEGPVVFTDYDVIADNMVS